MEYPKLEFCHKTVRKEAKRVRMQSKCTYLLFLEKITHPICFTLCDDNFGVKYIGKENSQHLMEVLEKHYTISHLS